MITEIPQLIRCRYSTKTEIPRDHAAPRARARRGSPRTALTLTTHRSKPTGLSPADRDQRLCGWATMITTDMSVMRHALQGKRDAARAARQR
jgi:hypothetical protein